jgi:SAM-dependent methyltransferase
MASIKLHARLRRSPLSRWIVDLKIWADHLRWKFSGEDSQTLSPVAKRRQILDVLRSRGLRTVVETGTFLGDTTHFLASRGYRVVTIEVDQRLADLARARFAGSVKVQTVEGDSGALMPGLIAKLDQAALFYLDGHYSGSGTGRGEHETPVVKEVEAILAGAHDGSFVIIDDARCFGALPDFPPLPEFLTRLKSRGVDHVVVSDDNIRFAIRRNPTARSSP